MSYQINIGGHLEGENVPERVQAIAVKAQEFVKTIEGISWANFQADPTDDMELSVLLTPEEINAVNAANGPPT